MVLIIIPLRFYRPTERQALSFYRDKDSFLVPAISNERAKKILNWKEKDEMNE